MRIALLAQFIPKGCYAQQPFCRGARCSALKVVVPFIPGGRGVQVGLAHDPITVAEVGVHPES